MFVNNLKTTILRWHAGRFRSGLLALASLVLAWRDHRPDFSSTFTTML
jgi:hypothetical protein